MALVFGSDEGKRVILETRERQRWANVAEIRRRLLLIADDDMSHPLWGWAEMAVNDLDEALDREGIEL